jgi:hypothetical protein
VHVVIVRSRCGKQWWPRAQVYWSNRAVLHVGLRWRWCTPEGPFPRHITLLYRLAPGVCAIVIPVDLWAFG